MNKAISYPVASDYLHVFDWIAPHNGCDDDIDLWFANMTATPIERGRDSRQYYEVTLEPQRPVSESHHMQTRYSMKQQYNERGKLSVRIVPAHTKVI